MFGPLTHDGSPAVFPGCWERAYPLCERCWHDTRSLAQQRPAVIIHDATSR